MSRKFNLYPKSPKPEEFYSAYEIDSLLNSIDDYLVAFNKYHSILDGDRRQDTLDQWLYYAESWFGALERRLTNNAEQYLCGSKLTVADFAIISVFYSKVLNTYGQPLPLLKSLYERHTNLKAYIERNLETEEFGVFLKQKRQEILSNL